MMMRAILFLLCLLPHLAQAQTPRTAPQWPAMVGAPLGTNLVLVWQPEHAATSTAQRQTTITNFFGAMTSAQVAAALGYTPVNRAGDTLTGYLTLHAAPASNFHAATKKYVDDSVSASGTPPGGSSGQLQYNNAGAFGGFTLGGDCTLSQPNITCTKTGGTNFGYFATGTDAANLSGTIAIARIPTGTATSSSTIPLNNDARLNVIEIPFSFSGGTTIAASVPIVRVIGAANGISIAANPTWYSWCDTLPTASMTFTLKQRHSGSTTSIGNIVIGTGGTVTSSPTWSAVTLAQGEAIIVTSPSSADATANGCGLVVVGARL